jgi:histidinol-phosphate/aromatic aminotransferase/cobyric acid decarboxylase-like protein
MTFDVWLPLQPGLTALRHPVRPSAASFVLVGVGDAAAFRRTLLPHAIVVRDCTPFGLPAHVRIACRVPEQCALTEVVVRLKGQGSLPEWSSA